MIKYRIVNGVCTLNQCASPKQLDVKGVCRCVKNLVYDQAANTCGCLSGETLNQTTGFCEHPPLPCSRYDPQTGRCASSQCGSGFVTISGNCQRPWMINATYFL